MHVTPPFFRCTTVLVWLITLFVAGSFAFSQEQKTEATDPITITGRVVDSQSDGIADARVSIHYRQPFETAQAETQTDASGDFSIQVNSKPVAFRQWKIVARTSDGSQIGFFRYDPSQETTIESEVEIQVEPTASHPVQVADAEGNPVADARVAVQFGYPHSIDGLRTNADGRVETFAPKSERILSVMAWKDGVGFDYQVYALGRNQQSDLKTPVPEFPVDGETLRLEGASPVTVTVVDPSGKPIEGVQLYPWLLHKESANRELNLSYFADSVSQRTDASGKAMFAWMPAWQTSVVTIWPTADGFTRTRANYDPAVDQGELTVTLDHLVAIRGRVFDEQGNPAIGISVQALGVGYGWDDGRDQTTSADDGSYELRVPPEQIYMVTVSDDHWVADAVPSFAVNSGRPVEGIDLNLRKPTRVTGQLKAEPSGEPIKNERVFVYQYGDDLRSIEGAEIANPDNSRRYVRPMIVKTAMTDDEGRFMFSLGDGTFDIRPPRQEKTDDFEVSGQSTLTIDVTTEIQSKIKLVGTIRHHVDDHPLPGIRLMGVSQRFSGDDWEALTDDDGTFAVERLGEPTYVHAQNADQSLAAVAVLPADQDILEMNLKPTGSAHGILHQTDSDTPAGQTRIRYGIRVPDENNQTWSNRFGGSVVTDSEGRFELSGLVPGWEYELDLEPQSDGTIPSLDSVTVDPGKRVDMGTMNIPAPPKPYVPPTLDERIAKAMGVDGSSVDRFKRAVERCKLNQQKLLIVAGKPDDPRLRRFMELRYEDRDYREVRDDFVIMALSTSDPEKAADVENLLDELGVQTSGHPAQFSLVLVDSAGALIDQGADESLFNEEELSKDAVIEWLRSHIGAPVNALELFNEALATAKKQNKRVLVQETATWCGPCHMLSNFLNDNREWEADYIWIKMDHRFTGAREIMADLRDGAGGGIPWFAILDADGKKLTTSNHFQSGDNVGFPSSNEGREHFKRMLLDSRISMTDDQIEAFVAGLRKEE